MSTCVLFLHNPIKHSEFFCFPYSFRISFSLTNCGAFSFSTKFMLQIEAARIIILIHFVHKDHCVSHHLSNSFIFDICEHFSILYKNYFGAAQVAQHILFLG